MLVVFPKSRPTCLDTCPVIDIPTGCGLSDEAPLPIQERGHSLDSVGLATPFPVNFPCSPRPTLHIDVILGGLCIIFRGTRALDPDSIFHFAHGEEART